MSEKIERYRIILVRKEHNITEFVFQKRVSNNIISVEIISHINRLIKINQNQHRYFQIIYIMVTSFQYLRYIDYVDQKLK